MKTRKQLLSVLLILSMLLSCFPGAAFAETGIATETKQLVFLSATEDISGGIRWSQLSSTPETVYDEELSESEGEEYYSFTGCVGTIATVDGETYTGQEITGNPVVTMSFVESQRISWLRGGTGVIVTCFDSWDDVFTLSFPKSDEVHQVTALMVNTPEVSNCFLYDGSEPEAPVKPDVWEPAEQYEGYRVLHALGYEDYENGPYAVYEFIPGKSGMYEVYGDYTTTDPNVEYVSVTAYTHDIDPSGNLHCFKAAEAKGGMLNGKYDGSFDADFVDTSSYYVVAEYAGLELGELNIRYAGEGSDEPEDDGVLTDEELFYMITVNQKMITPGEEYDCTENGYFYQTIPGKAETFDLHFTDCEFGGTVYMMTVYNHTANLGSMEDYSIETIDLEDRTIEIPGDALVYIYGKADSADHYAKFVMTAASETPEEPDFGEVPGELYTTYASTVESFDAQTGQVTLKGEHPHIMGRGLDSCNPNVTYEDRYVFLTPDEDGNWYLVEDVALTPVGFEDEDLWFEKNTDEEPFTFYYVMVNQIGEYKAEAWLDDETIMSLTMNATWPWEALYPEPKLDLDTMISHELPWKKAYGEEKTFYIITRGLCGEPENWTVEVSSPEGVTADYYGQVPYGEETYYAYAVTLEESMIGEELRVKFNDEKFHEEHESEGNCEGNCNYRIVGGGPEPGFLYAVYNYNVTGYDAQTGELTVERWASIMGEGSELCRPRAVEGEGYTFMELGTDGKWYLVDNVSITAPDNQDTDLRVERTKGNAGQPMYNVWTYQIGKYEATATLRSGEGALLSMSSIYPSMGLYAEPKLDLDVLAGDYEVPWKKTYGEEKTFYLIMNGLCGEQKDWVVGTKGPEGLTVTYQPELKLAYEEETYYVYAVTLSKDMMHQECRVFFTDEAAHDNGEFCEWDRGFRIVGAGPEPGNLYAIHPWDIEFYDEKSGEIIPSKEYANIMGEGCNLCEPSIKDGENYVFMEYIAEEDGADWWKLVDGVKVEAYDVTDDKVTLETEEDRDYDYPVYRLTTYQIGRYTATAEKADGSVLSMSIYSGWPHMGIYTTPELTVEGYQSWDLPWKSDYGYEKTFYLISRGLCDDPEDWKISVEESDMLTGEDFTLKTVITTEDEPYYVYAVKLNEDMMGENFDVHLSDSDGCDRGKSFRIVGAGPEPGSLYATYDGDVASYDAKSGELTLHEWANVMGEGCELARPSAVSGDWYTFMELGADGKWYLVEDVTMESVDGLDDEFKFIKRTGDAGQPIYEVRPYQIAKYEAEAVLGDGTEAFLSMSSRFPNMSLYTQPELEIEYLVGDELVWDKDFGKETEAYIIMDGLCGEPYQWNIDWEGSELLTVDYMSELHDGKDTYYIFKVYLHKDMIGRGLYVEFSDEAAHDKGSCTWGFGFRIVGAGPEPGYLYAVYEHEIDTYDAETGLVTLQEDATVMGEGCEVATPDIALGDCYAFLEYLEDGSWRLVEDVTVHPMEMMDDRLEVEKNTDRRDYPIYIITPFEECDYWVQEVAEKGTGAAECLSMIMKSEFPHTALYENKVIDSWSILRWNYTWKPNMTTPEVYLITRGLCGEPGDWTFDVNGFDDLVPEDIQYEGTLYRGMTEYHVFRVPLDQSMLGYEFEIVMKDEGKHNDGGSCDMSASLSIAAELMVSDVLLDSSMTPYEMGEQLYRNFAVADGETVTKYLYMVTYDYNMPEEEKPIMAVVPFTSAENLSVRFLVDEDEDGPVWIEEDHGLTFTQAEKGSNKFIITADYSKNSEIDPDNWNQGYSAQVGQSGNLWIEIDRPHAEWVFSETPDLDKLELTKENKELIYDAVARYIEIDGTKAANLDLYMYLAYFDTSDKTDSSNLTKIEAVNVTEEKPWILSYFAGWDDEGRDTYNLAENLSVTQKEGNLYTFSYTGTVDKDMVVDWDGDMAYYVEQERDGADIWAAYILLANVTAKPEFKPETGKLYAVHAFDGVFVDHETGRVELDENATIMGEGAEPFQAPLKQESFFRFIEYIEDDEEGGYWRFVTDVTFVPDGMDDGCISVRRMGTGFDTMYYVVPNMLKEFTVDGTGFDGMPVSMTMTSVFPDTFLSKTPYFSEEGAQGCHMAWPAEAPDLDRMYLFTDVMCAENPEELKFYVEGTAGLKDRDIIFYDTMTFDGREYYVYEFNTSKEMIGEDIDIHITDEGVHSKEEECCNRYVYAYFNGTLMMSASELDIYADITTNMGLLHQDLNLADDETVTRYLYMVSWSEDAAGRHYETIYPVTPREVFQIRFQTGVWEEKYPAWLQTETEFGFEDDLSAPGLNVKNVSGNLYSFTADFDANSAIDPDNMYNNYDVHLGPCMGDYGDVHVTLNHDAVPEKQLPDSYVLRWYDVSGAEGEIRDLAVFGNSNPEKYFKFVVTDSGMNRQGEHYFVDVKAADLVVYVYDKNVCGYMPVVAAENPFSINDEDGILKITYDSSRDILGPSYKLVFTGNAMTEDKYLDNKDGVPAVRELMIWTENVKHSIDTEQIKGQKENQIELDLTTETYEGLENQKDVEVKNVSVEIPETLFGEADDQLTVTEETTMEIKTDLGNVTFDSSVLTQIAEQTEEKAAGVVLEVVRIDVADVTNESMTEALEAAEVILDLNLYCGDEKLTQFGEGAVTVTLHYEMSEESKAAGKMPIVYYVDETGEKHVVDYTYDEETCELRFTTNHFSVFSVEETEGTETPEVLLGDVNLDGDITAGDLTMLARHVAKIETINDTTSLANAEVTGDGDITAEDLTKLARYVAKIIDSLE